jgi:GNAT superfamily N-acetyltransferase
LADGAERCAAVARLAASWGDPMIARGERWPLCECDILIAGSGEGIAAVCGRDRPIAEIVAIEAFDRRRGVGTALIGAIVAHFRGSRPIRLSTTNDNLDALRLYKRRDFTLAALRPGAVTAARVAKTSIPLVGDYGVEIRDEIDLVLPLPEVDSLPPFL